jgi:hypothetical protein
MPRSFALSLLLVQATIILWVNGKESTVACHPTPSLPFTLSFMQSHNEFNHTHDKFVWEALFLLTLNVIDKKLKFVQLSLCF